MEGVLGFLEYVGKLKRVKRSGWLRYLNPEISESVGDHSYGVAAHFLALSDEGFSVNGQRADRTRCIMMALTHDLAESIVGDITPYDSITHVEKRRRERDAMIKICSSLESKRSEEVIALWEEYEEGTSAEAQLVKDADKFDMIVQAFSYEQLHGVSLEEFFESTATVFKTKAFQTLNMNLREKRENWKATKSISPGNIF